MIQKTWKTVVLNSVFSHAGSTVKNSCASGHQHRSHSLFRLGIFRYWLQITESQEQPKDDKQQGQNEASTKSGHYFKHYKKGFYTQHKTLLQHTRR